MVVLALDTTSRAGSVALVSNGRIVVERPGDPARSHAERLPGDLLKVLGEAGIALSDVDLFAVAAGPGSFTGLRVGIATIQGLAFVERKHVAAVTVLEALAHVGAAHAGSGALVGALMDAHRRDVFSALYRVMEAQPFSPERLVEIEPPAVGQVATVLDRWGQQFGMPAVWACEDATPYRVQLDGSGTLVEAPVLAGMIGRMAMERARAGRTVEPGGIQPVYVRRPDAEIARERAGGMPGSTGEVQEFHT
jgi:tRNA threonylcarbamoyladenosine biosynthesis protein TsaB